MNRIDKALAKLSSKERIEVKQILLHIQNSDYDQLDVKKLAGRTDIYRVRKGNIRIIFRRKSEVVSILAIERRSSRTYKNI